MALPTLFLFSIFGFFNMGLGIFLLVFSNVSYCRRTGQNSFRWLWSVEREMSRQERFINRLGITLTSIGLVICWSIVGWTDFFLPEGWSP